METSYLACCVAGRQEVAVVTGDRFCHHLLLAGSHPPASIPPSLTEAPLHKRVEVAEVTEVTEVSQDLRSGVSVCVRACVLLSLSCWRGQRSGVRDPESPL